MKEVIHLGSASRVGICGILGLTQIWFSNFGPGALHGGQSNCSPGPHFAFISFADFNSGQDFIS